MPKSYALPHCSVPGNLHGGGGGGVLEKTKNVKEMYEAFSEGLGAGV